jgi:hypothetical protein
MCWRYPGRRHIERVSSSVFPTAILQCSGRPFAFVVHGLWPQYTQRFPPCCHVPAPRVDAKLVSAMLDMMPSRQLIYYEWNRHGTCSGLTAQTYFDALRKARAAVTIPAAYRDPAEPLTVSPAEVAAAFIKANPGLSADAVVVACNKTRLSAPVPGQGSFISRLCRHQPPQLPARQDRDASGSRRMKYTRIADGLGFRDRVKRRLRTDADVSGWPRSVENLRNNPVRKIRKLSRA